MASVSSLMVARFMRLARRSGEGWQGGLVRMPMWVDDAAGNPRRPWGGVWVSLESGMVNVKLEVEADSPLALESLMELGLKFTHSRPARLEVADEAMGRELVEALGDPELAVTVLPSLPAVSAMLERMAADLPDGPLPPDALTVRGVTVERVRAFADAAREFYAAAPWRHLSDEDLVHVESPIVPRGLQHLTVLGGAGQTFGLGFFPTAKDFERLLADPDPATLLRRDGRWSVLYGPAWETPFGDLDLWEACGLPLAGESAYPTAIWFGPDGRLRRPDATMLAQLEGILRALARTSEDEMDGGRWSHEVPTADGPRVVTLALPDLLLPLDAPPARRGPGLPDRRVLERVLLEAQRFVAGADFAGEAELAAAFQRRFSGSADQIPSTAATPLEQAQDLAYQAVEARGRRRIVMARKALELSPDCADAYGILAEAATDAERACEIYAQAVAAAERALGPEVFAERAGEFWGDITTRPYMRARFGLAQTLSDLGRRAEAIEHYRELLRLNPGDNQGVRDPCLILLLQEGRDGEAGELLERYGDDSKALWQYGRALWTYRRDGDSRIARERLRAALRSNRRVPPYLTADREWDGPLPDSYAMGSEEEAAICAAELEDVWRMTEGAERWLRANAPRPKSKKHRRT